MSLNPIGNFFSEHQRLFPGNQHPGNRNDRRIAKGIERDVKQANNPGDRADIEETRQKILGSVLSFLESNREQLVNSVSSRTLIKQWQHLLFGHPHPRQKFLDSVLSFLESNREQLIDSVISRTRTKQWRHLASTLKMDPHHHATFQYLQSIFLEARQKSRQGFCGRLQNRLNNLKRADPGDDAPVKAMGLFLNYHLKSAYANSNNIKFMPIIREIKELLKKRIKEGNASVNAPNLLKLLSMLIKKMPDSSLHFDIQHVHQFDINHLYEFYYVKTKPAPGKIACFFDKLFGPEPINPPNEAIIKTNQVFEYVLAMFRAFIKTNHRQGYKEMARWIDKARLPIDLLNHYLTQEELQAIAGKMTYVNVNLAGDYIRNPEKWTSEEVDRTLSQFTRAEIIYIADVYINIDNEDMLAQHQVVVKAVRNHIQKIIQNNPERGYRLIANLINLGNLTLSQLNKLDPNLLVHVQDHVTTLFIHKSPYGREQTAQEIYDFISQFKNVRHLELSNINNILALPELNQLITLSVYHCPNFQLLHQINTLKSLSITFAPLLESIPLLVKLKDLHISHCDNFRQLDDGINELVNLVIQQCMHLRELPECNALRNLQLTSTSISSIRLTSPQLLNKLVYVRNRQIEVPFKLPAGMTALQYLDCSWSTVQELPADMISLTDLIIDRSKIKVIPDFPALGRFSAHDVLLDSFPEHMRRFPFFESYCRHKRKMS